MSLLYGPLARKGTAPGVEMSPLRTHARSLTVVCFVVWCPAVRREPPGLVGGGAGDRAGVAARALHRAVLHAQGPVLADAHRTRALQVRAKGPLLLCMERMRHHHVAGLASLPRLYFRGHPPSTGVLLPGCHSRCRHNPKTNTLATRVLTVICCAGARAGYWRTPRCA
jgi:hypothetical protein